MARPHTHLHQNEEITPRSIRLGALWNVVVNPVPRQPERPPNVILFPGVTLEPRLVDRLSVQLACLAATLLILSALLVFLYV